MFACRPCVLMTQSPHGYVKMDDVLPQCCCWCVNNRQILNVINHKGTAVSLYRKHYDMQQSLCMLCMDPGAGPRASGLAAPVRTCVLNVEVAQVWTSQVSPKHNHLIFHLIYHNLNSKPSWCHQHPFLCFYDLRLQTLLVKLPSDSYFLNVDVSADNIFDLLVLLEANAQTCMHDILWILMNSHHPSLVWGGFAPCTCFKGAVCKYFPLLYIQH